MKGRAAIQDFLARKWAKEKDYRLEKYLWAFTDRRIAVHFQVSLQRIQDTRCLPVGCARVCCRHIVYQYVSITNDGNEW